MKEVWCYIACYKISRPVRFHSIDREDAYSVTSRITWKTDAAIPNETMRITRREKKQTQLSATIAKWRRDDACTVHVETSLIEHAALSAYACHSGV